MDAIHYHVRSEGRFVKRAVYIAPGIDMSGKKDVWNGKYPKIYKFRMDNWAKLSSYFKYPESVRRLIYTTKVTKSKTIFPTNDSLLKMLAMMDITKKWIGHRQDWGIIHSQLEIYFEERLNGY